MRLGKVEFSEELRQHPDYVKIVPLRDIELRTKKYCHIQSYYSYSILHLELLESVLLRDIYCGVVDQG